MINAADVTIAAVEEELPGIRAYSARHGWHVTWDPRRLHLILVGQHPQNNTPVQVRADVDGYRAMPPAWTFSDPTKKRSADAFFPRSGSLPNGRSSIFHSSRRICAPFNRLAYKSQGGPHSNWGGPEMWLEVGRAGEVRAFRLADMFAVIVGHLAASAGMN